MDAKKTGNFIAEKRKEINMSQRELAEHLHITNYKNAKAFLAQADENTYDLYINVSQTLATKIFNDKDKSNNFLRVGNRMVVDYQSGLLLGQLPSEHNDESVMNIYYIDNFSAENITTNNGVLVWTRNSASE